MIKLDKKVATDKKAKNQKLKRSILAIAIVIAFVFSAALSLINFKNAEAYNNDAEKASSEVEQLKTDIDKIQNLIDGKGFDDYCEKIAREKYGYAKPGEHVIYDSSYEK